MEKRFFHRQLCRGRRNRKHQRHGKYFRRCARNKLLFQNALQGCCFQQLCFRQAVFNNNQKQVKSAQFIHDYFSVNHHSRWKLFNHVYPYFPVQHKRQQQLYIRIVGTVCKLKRSSIHTVGLRRHQCQISGVTFFNYDLGW